MHGARRFIPHLSASLPALLITIGAGCAAPPSPEFLVEQKGETAPLEVRFTDSSQGSLRSWAWDFGDGTTAVEQHPEHRYTKAGTFTVTLTASNGAGSATVTKAGVITVSPGPLERVEVKPSEIVASVRTAANIDVVAYDAFGNEKRDIRFSFSVDRQAGEVDESGRFTAGTKAGSFPEGFVATATEAGATRSGTARVRILPGAVSTAVLLPESAIVVAGRSVLFGVRAYDPYGNLIDGGKPSFTSTATAGSVDSGGNFTAGTKAGSYPAGVAVQVAVGNATAAASATVNIVADTVAHVDVTPAQGSVGVEGTLQFSAVGADKYGNVITGLRVAWSGGPLGGAIDQSGLFTAGRKAGLFENAVTASIAQGAVTASAAARVVVKPGPPVRVAVSASELTLRPQGQAKVTAKAEDAFGNVVEAETIEWQVFNESGAIDAPGAFTAATKAGPYACGVGVQIRAAGVTVKDCIGVVIRPGVLDKVVVAPERPLVIPGWGVQFKATASDAFGNEIADLPVTWETAAGGAIDREGHFVAGFLAGRYLQAIKATVTEDAKKVTGTASVDISLGGRGTAVIDGTMGAAEWSRAGRIDFAVNVPGGGTTPGSLFVMNDGTNLYVALRIRRSALEPINLVLRFDNDGDGVREAGDDELVVSESVKLADNHYSLTCPAGVPAGLGCGLPDETAGGSGDGKQSSANDSELTVIEASHPLDSLDDEHDFSVGLGGNVGLFTPHLVLNPGPQATFTEIRLPFARSGSQGLLVDIPIAE